MFGEVARELYADSASAAFSRPDLLDVVVALAQGPVVPPPPATPKRPVTDEYGATKVTDDGKLG